jgi:hypothetical protein
VISEAGISSTRNTAGGCSGVGRRHLPLIIWIMMNPSTADHQKNDPTILKIIRYSTKWGYGAVLVLNIYAFRTSRPENLPQVMREAVGKANDWWIRTIFEFAARKNIPVVCAWGVKHKDRGDWVRVAADEAGLHLMCLELALNAEPKHPRFLSEDLRPRPLQSKRR